MTRVEPAQRWRGGRKPLLPRNPDELRRILAESPTVAELSARYDCTGATVRDSVRRAGLGHMLPAQVTSKPFVLTEAGWRAVTPPSSIEASEATRRIVARIVAQDEGAA